MCAPNVPAIRADLARSRRTRSRPCARRPRSQGGRGERRALLDEVGREHGPGAPADVLSGLHLLGGDEERVAGLGERGRRGSLRCLPFADLCAIAVAVWRPGPPTLGVASALVAALATMVALRRRRELVLSPHVHELGRLRATAVEHSEPLETSLGVALSCYPLPDGRLDWVLSASHPSWSAETARRLAADLWPGGEVVLGRTPGVIHVIAARADL